MKEREKAIMSISNRRYEAPEVSRMLDYNIGDIVQIKKKGEYAGRVGTIIGINIIKSAEPEKAIFLYTVKLSDKSSLAMTTKNLIYLRHGDEMSGTDTNSSIPDQDPAEGK